MFRQRVQPQTVGDASRFASSQHSSPSMRASNVVVTATHRSPNVAPFAQQMKMVGTSYLSNLNDKI